VPTSGPFLTIELCEKVRFSYHEMNEFRKIMFFGKTANIYVKTGFNLSVGIVTPATGNTKIDVVWHINNFFD